MRRQNREVLGIENILAILRECEVLRVGFCDGETPYIVPMNFAFELLGGELFIYLHCAKSGRKLDIITSNNKVCFEADCSCKIIKKQEPCAWTSEFKSVIGNGEIFIIKDEASKITALNIFMSRYGFEGALNYSKQALANVELLKICVKTLSAKANILGV